MLKRKFIPILLLTIFSGCASMPERDLSSFHKEELFALKNFPCLAVGNDSVWKTGKHSFSCSMGEFNEMTYLVYQNEGEVYKTVVVWKDFIDGSFFRTEEGLVENVLGKLSDEYAPNDKERMLDFPNSRNPYTFYTKHLKIKHEVEVFRKGAQAYDLHRISFEK